MYNEYDSAALAAAFAAIIGLVLIGALVGYIITSILFMKLFEKAGVQGKWRAWVPVYNTMIFAKLGDVNPWAVLIVGVGGFVLGLIPYLGPILSWVAYIAAAALSIMAALRIQQKLAKDTLWILLAILVNWVWLGILAFDSSRWNLAVPPAQWARVSYLADSTVWGGIPVQTPTGAAPQYPPAAPQA